MAKVVEGVKQDKLGAASVVPMLKGKGVKAEEIKWSGIETWLEGKKSVTKQEVLEFIRGNELQIEEIEKDGREAEWAAEDLEAKDAAMKKAYAGLEAFKAEWRKEFGRELEEDSPFRLLYGGIRDAISFEKTRATRRAIASAEDAAVQVLGKHDFLGYHDEDGAADLIKSAIGVVGMIPSEGAKVSADEVYLQYLKAMDRTGGRLYGELTQDEIDVLLEYNRANAAAKTAAERFDSIERRMFDVAAPIREAADVMNRFSDKYDEETAERETRWEEYTLDGGENYREILFKLPGSVYDNDAMQSHWGYSTSGILAHARVQDFDTANGKMLFVEEIQSDWHNAGHKKGYGRSEDVMRAAQQRADELKNKKWLQRGALKREIEAVLAASGTDSPASVASTVVNNPEWADSLIAQGAFDPDLAKRVQEYHELRAEEDAAWREVYAEENKAPDAPFKDTYHEFVLKRLLRMAAEGGYSSLGWTTGKLQEERWSSNYAEGYRIEYDQDIPKFLNKYGKKWGAVVGKTTIETGDTDRSGNPRFDGGNYTAEVWSIPITDAMRESVLYEGQPQYSLKGEHEMRREIDRIRKEGRKAGKSRQEIETEVMGVVGPEYGKLLKTYGEIKRGERPYREISVPRLTEKGRKVSQTVRTILEAEVTPDAAVPTLQELITQGDFSYDVYTDKAALATAEATIRNKGYETALADWLSDVKEGKVNKTNTALGWALYNAAATKGDLKTAMTILNGMVRHQRNAAQALQATRILKKMSPEAQLYGIQKTVDGINEELQQRYGGKTGKRSVSDADNVPVELWMQKTGELLADQLGKAVKKKTRKEKTVSQRVLADLRKLARETVKPAAMPADTRTEMDSIYDMFNNKAQYEKALAAAKETAAKEYGNNPEIMSALDKWMNTAFDYTAQFTKEFTGQTEIQIPTELVDKFLSQTDQDGRDAVTREIYRYIGSQMPSTFIDKWNAWRYLAMLGNPRTHVRNVVGNLGFAPVVMAKDMTATAIENVVGFVSRGKLGRTKAMPNAKLLKAAWEDYANVADQVTAGGKYSDSFMQNQYIQEGREIFKFKPLEKARKGNSAALEVEDMWFAQPHYAFALAQYCKAHGVTADQLRNGKALGNARDYAIREAQKATYRDTNAFSQTISEMGRYHGDNKVKKGVSVVMEGILPFRKTPANILVRGIEYSPIGLLNGVKQALVDVRKGTKTGAEAIDSIAAGLTGTVLLRLGIYLAAEGLIRGAGGDDEKEKKFEELQGHQTYALELPDGKSVTLDWLAPEVLPLFIGVNLYETASENKGVTNLSDILSAVTNVTEPLLEMSCLQSLNDLFDSVGYAASGGGLSALPTILVSAATSYLTQAFPTILGQAERSAQDERMTTYTEKNGFLTSDMQYTLGKISAKTPGWDFQQIPYVDAWGRTESTGSKAGNIFNNFLNPAYMSQIETSEMEEELARLHDEKGDEYSVLPSRPSKYFNVDGDRKDLTAEEYVKYATEKGQLSYDILTDLTGKQEYDSLPDAEKGRAVELAYEYASAIAKSKVSDYNPDSWVAKALDAEAFSGMDETEYILYKVALNMADQNNNDNDSYDNAEKAAAIASMPGLSDADIAAVMDSEAIYNAYNADIDMRTLMEYIGEGNTFGKADADKLIGAKNAGMSEEQYFGYRDTLKAVDQPNSKGELGGTATNAEKAAAVAKMSDLDNQGIAYLWGTDQAHEAHSYGVDMRKYAQFKGVVDSFKGDDKQQQIKSYLKGMNLSAKDYLYLYGTVYSSVKDDADYLYYFGN
jgi:hypothetical protein